MINKEKADIQAALTGEKNGLITIPGSIWEMSSLYEADSGGGNGMRQSYEDFACVTGMLAVLKKYLTDISCQVPVNEDYRKRILSLYLTICAAPFNGWKVSPVLYETGQDPTGRVFHSYFARTRGYSLDPDRILALKMGSRVCAVFDPEAGIMLPSADFQEIPDLEGFIARNPAIVKRTCAYINMVCTGLSDPYGEALLDLFHGLVGRFTSKELEEEAALLRSEPKEDIPAAVRAYLGRVAPGLNASLVCGHPGANEGNILLERACLIVVSEDAASEDSTWRIGKDLELIPPLVLDSERPEMLSCRSGIAEDGSPWAEVTVSIRGTSHRRAYNLAAGRRVIANPNSVVDMQAGIPAGILDKYNYYEQGSNAIVRHDTIPHCYWSMFPIDGTEVSDEFESYQDRTRRWTIHQRKTPVTHLRLSYRNPDAGVGDIPLGTIILQDSHPTFFKKENIRNVAFDLGSSRSVRLMTVKGTGKFEPPTGSRQGTEADREGPCGTLSFLRPMTTMSVEDLIGIEELSYDRLGDGNAYIEPLLQRFHLLPCVKGASPVTTGLLAGHRNWRPDQEKLFDALMKDTGSMNDARTRIGVEAAPKEKLANSDLAKEDRDAARYALRFYIGTLFMEAVFQAAPEGYSFSSGNLFFGVSFPDNGLDTGLTRELEEAITGAAAYVNGYLAPGNRLAEDVNLFLFAENRATSVWHMKNPPEGKYLGETTAAATSDCGNTTLDFTLSVRGHAYSCSIPYAGRDITNTSLAEVYGKNLADLLYCFPSAPADLRKKAADALDAASKAAYGRLEQRLGFSMTLNRLFNESDFNVKGPNADRRMHLMQRLISIKERITIPAIAATIARAVRNGDVRLDDEVLIAPVGQASLALESTCEGFRYEYAGLVRKQVQQILGMDFQGNIVFLSNNDVDKRSVAEGILYMMEGEAPGLADVPLFASEEAKENHYLEMIYGNSESEKKRTARDRLRSLDQDKTADNYSDAVNALYENAYEVLMDGYSYEDFEKSYNTWALTGRADNGRTDRLIRNEVKKDFRNMMAEARETRKFFIMSYPGVEKEHVCGCLLDICLRRVASSL